ncbi:MAG: hypothetical protein LBE37_12380 [Sphingobacterium sp.]|nr:hypothetical protein [Sphingobacterium sp.]
MLKVKFIYPLTVIMIGSFTACKKSASDELVTPDPEVVDPKSEGVTELKFVIKNLANSNSVKEKEGYDEFNFLGYGYDVTGKYSHRSSVKDAVINTPAFAQENPSSLDIRRPRERSFRTVYGADSEGFLKLLTGEKSDVSYFKGNITQPFGDTDPTANQYVYGLYDSFAKYKQLTIFYTKSKVMSYLTKGFQADIKTMGAEDLVRKYGTHVLLSLFTGAKLSLDYQAEYTGSKDKHTAVQSSFHVGLNECFGLFSGAFAPSDSTVFKDVVRPIIAFEAIGGDPSKIVVNRNSGVNPKVNISDWTKDLNEDNSRFVYIGGLDSLLPISELIADVEKKQKVEAFITEYIKSSQVKSSQVKVKR